MSASTNGSASAATAAGTPVKSEAASTIATANVNGDSSMNISNASVTSEAAATSTPTAPGVTPNKEEGGLDLDAALNGQVNACDFTENYASGRYLLTD